MSQPPRHRLTHASEVDLDPRLPARTRAIPPLRHGPRRTILVVVVTLSLVLFAYHQVYSLYDPARSSSASRSRRHATVIRATDAPFPPSPHPLPVHFDERLVLYDNIPVAASRPPANQFLLDPAVDLSRPELAIITATNNARPELLDTATTVFGQSLQNFAWIIVDDHTTEPASLDLLRELARDPRVTVVPNPRAQGLAASRNVGIEHVLTHYASTRVPPYLLALDDDDLFELTAFEKSIWMLKSNPEWDLAGFRYIKFGSSNETVMTGLHSGQDNYLKGNFVPNSAIFTARALVKSSCRYDEVEFDAGGEDWDFWMCLAEHGFWGGSLIEPLYWQVSRHVRADPFC